MGLSCHCKKKKCHLTINEEERRKIYDGFWELDYNQRKQFVAKHMQTFPLKSHTTNDSKRNNSRCYYLTSETVNVCKIMFLNTLGFKNDSILTTVANTTDYVGIVNQDMRGKAKKPKAVSEDHKKFIKEHIFSFQPVCSHYR